MSNEPDPNDSSYNRPAARVGCAWCGGWFTEDTFEDHICVDDQRWMPPPAPKEP
jgi:hypothetical protein